MKNVVALALLFGIAVVAFITLGAAAQAKLVAGDWQPAAVALADFPIATAPIAVTREREYFRMPQQPADTAGRLFLCRAPQVIFDTTRIAQACR